MKLFFKKMMIFLEKCYFIIINIANFLKKTAIFNKKREIFEKIAIFSLKKSIFFKKLLYL